MLIKNYPFNVRQPFVDSTGNLTDQAVRQLQANIPNFADALVPVGVIDGANKVFALQDAGGNPVSPSPVDSFKLRKRAAAATSWTVMAKTTGYSLSGATLTYVTAPAAGDLHECDFRFLSPP